jgi:hypothetical protein
MDTYHWNGEYWYEKTDGALRRVLRWFIWIGGGSLRKPTPVSVLGHRITLYSGRRWDFRTSHGYLSRDRDGSIFWSPDGTTTRATDWYRGAPDGVVVAALSRYADKFVELNVQPGDKPPRSSL